MKNDTNIYVLTFTFLYVFLFIDILPVISKTNNEIKFYFRSF